jgi:hypothetical protein
MHMIGGPQRRVEGTRGRHPDYRRPTLSGLSQGALVSKKTKKRKLNARRKKANHGRRPNAGRR